MTTNATRDGKLATVPEVIEWVCLSFTDVTSPPKKIPCFRNELSNLFGQRTWPERTPKSLLYHETTYKRGEEEGYIMNPYLGLMAFFDMTQARTLTLREYAPNVWLSYHSHTFEFTGVYSFSTPTQLEGTVWQDWQNIVREKTENQRLHINLHPRTTPWL